jgi:hypothetical protein
MYDIYVSGGLMFMHMLSLILLINLSLILFVLISRLQKKPVKENVLETIRQLGGLALAWGVFSTVIGLFFAFDDLAGMKETLPLYVIMGGLKVALITILYGLIIFMISILSFIGLRSMMKNSSN